MKRLIIPFVILAAVACTRELPEVLPSAIINNEITITASYGDPETRTERATGGAVNWLPGDEISVFYGSGVDGGSKFISQNTAPTPTANFTGTIGVITGGNDVSIENTYFWAVYPYNPTASCNGSSITTTLPSSQVATADTFADDLFPSVGRSQGLVMGFYNICGGLKFTISEEGIKSVTLRGHNNEILSGTLTVGFDDAGLPVVQSITDGSESITVYAPQGTTFQVGKAYYIVLVPTAFEQGFTLTFQKENTCAVYDRPKDTRIRRATFGILSTPDAGLEWNALPYVPIPDANFKAYMIQNYDTNGNGELDFDEAESITTISVSTQNIASLSGIEYCRNLDYLFVTGTTGNKGKLKCIDVSSNVLLAELRCYDNQLESLILGANPALKRINCYRNQLKSLDVSGCTSLTYLYCYENQLTSLNVSGCTALTYLNCNTNQLTDLDVSECVAMYYLNCNTNRLENLDIRSNTSLYSVYCNSNQLTSLDVSANPALTSINCGDNRITSLDVSNNVLLQSLQCYKNQLTSLDVSANTALTSLLCYSNQLTCLDVSSNTSLTYLSCHKSPTLAELWLLPGHYIDTLTYDDTVTTIKYKGLNNTPVVINSADELIAFLSDPADVAELGSDIDLAGRMIPAVEHYCGVFDGKGHMIMGLESSKPLFSTLDGSVTSIIFDSSCCFTPSVPIFGIVAGTNNGSIQGVVNNASVSYNADAISEPILIASIAGVSTGSITDCVNEGAVSVTSTGGVVGLGVAGIVAYQSFKVENCINRGLISFSAPYITSKATVVDATGALPGIGGVSAIGAPGFSMKNCDNYGKVSYSLYAAETNLTQNMNRNQIGGVVSSPCGEVRGCNNYGEVIVSLKHSAPGTELPYEFIACVGGIGGGDYLFTGANSSENKSYNTQYINCTNEGLIIVDSDASRSNTAVGGVVGWPGQEQANSGYVNSCVNKGSIIGRGVMKCRLGGVSGGTGQMLGCTNEGIVTLESGNIGSALGSLCGFHSQKQYISSCVAKGEVICNVPDVNGGISGFIGNMGNVENTTAYSCIVDCKITVATYDPTTVGMVVGKYNGTSRTVVLGYDYSPIQVSGSINGTPASDSNIYGTANDLNHTIYYVIN